MMLIIFVYLYCTDTVVNLFFFEKSNIFWSFYSCLKGSGVIVDFDDSGFDCSQETAFEI